MAIYSYIKTYFSFRWGCRSLGLGYPGPGPGTGPGAGLGAGHRAVQDRDRGSLSL